MTNKKINKKENSKLVENKDLDKPAPKKTKEKENIQTKWAIVLMVGLLLIIILVPLFKFYFIDKFIYSGLNFQKTQLEKMVFYSTKIPVSDAYGKIIGSFSINFRNDPRKLEEINTIIKTGVPTFNKKDVVYISLSDMNRNCVEGSAATLTLSGFLTQFAQMNLSAGMSNEKIANETGFPYITCGNTKKNTVINIIEGNKTEVRQISSECYELEYKDCEVMKTTERFIIEIIKGYMKGFKRDYSFLDRFRTYDSD